jgi:hypothetical protein
MLQRERYWSIFALVRTAPDTTLSGGGLHHVPMPSGMHDVETDMNNAIARFRTRKSHTGQTAFQLALSYACRHFAHIIDRAGNRVGLHAV